MNILNLIPKFFNTWGGLIQSVVALVIGGITIYIMCQQLKNRNMMKELKAQTKSIGDQLALMIELNPPCLVLQSGRQMDALSNRYSGYFINAGRSMFDLSVVASSGGRIVNMRKVNLKHIPKNTVINLGLTFDDTHTSFLSPQLTLTFKDKEGTVYYQDATLTDYNIVTLTGSRLSPH